MVDTATALRDISDRTIILTRAVQPRSMRHSDIAINGQGIRVGDADHVTERQVQLAVARVLDVDALET